MKYLYYKQNRSQKADLVKSIFNTIGTCFLLVIINKAVSPHHFWARIPIMIMMATVIFKVIKFLGHKVAESIDAVSYTHLDPYIHKVLWEKLFFLVGD